MKECDLSQVEMSLRNAMLQHGNIKLPDNIAVIRGKIKANYEDIVTYCNNDSPYWGIVLYDIIIDILSSDASSEVKRQTRKIVENAFPYMGEGMQSEIMQVMIQNSPLHDAEKTIELLINTDDYDVLREGLVKVGRLVSEHGYSEWVYVDVIFNKLVRQPQFKIEDIVKVIQTEKDKTIVMVLLADIVNYCDNVGAWAWQEFFKILPNIKYNSYNKVRRFMAGVQKQLRAGNRELMLPKSNLDNRIMEVLVHSDNEEIFYSILLGTVAAAEDVQYALRVIPEEVLDLEEPFMPTEELVALEVLKLASMSSTERYDYLQSHDDMKELVENKYIEYFQEINNP